MIPTSNKPDVNFMMAPFNYPMFTMPWMAPTCEKSGGSAANGSLYNPLNSVQSFNLAKMTENYYRQATKMTNRFFPYTWPMFRNTNTASYFKPNELLCYPPPISTMFSQQQMFTSRMSNPGSLTLVNNGLQSSILQNSAGTSSVPGIMAPPPIPAFPNGSLFNNQSLVQPIPCPIPISATSLVPPKPKTNEKFDEVSGRLCLLSGSRKFPVSVNEMKRRISGPESLHVSLINGILRKGKGKDNGKMMRAQLQPHNIILPSGRRKTAPTTGFTAFCEGEAMSLAADFGTILKREGRPDVIAKKVFADLLAKHSLEKIAVRLTKARYVLEALIRMYGNVPENPDDIVPKNPAEAAISHFSLLTHGFGHNAIKGSLAHLKEIFNHVNILCQNSLLQQRKAQLASQQPGTSKVA